VLTTIPSLVFETPVENVAWPIVGKLDSASDFSGAAWRQMDRGSNRLSSSATAIPESNQSISESSLPSSVIVGVKYSSINNQKKEAFNLTYHRYWLSLPAHTSLATSCFDRVFHVRLLLFSHYAPPVPLIFCFLYHLEL
jgi:hypothetical protein